MVDISFLGFNAHCMLLTRLFALCIGNTLCIRYQLATLFTIRTQIVNFPCVDCASYMRDWDKHRSTKTQVCAPLVPNVRLSLV